MTRVFAISDLHLPGPEDKDMGVFGPHWSGYVRRIRANWLAAVSPTDVILVPGDISWAMKLDEMGPDFAYLASLPGTIVIVKGNHDYWWQSLTQVRSRLPSNVRALQNDCFAVSASSAVCGTRGWLCPGHPEFGEADEKVYRREVNRLRLSLSSAIEAGLSPDFCMLHYPPANGSEETGFTELLEEFGVKICVYGHLHGSGPAINGAFRGVTYHLVSCDALEFRPMLIGEV